MIIIRGISCNINTSAKRPNGGTFITVKGMKKSSFFRFCKNSINVAHCRKKIFVDCTYPLQETC